MKTLRLVLRSVLIIDDHAHWQGARRVVDECFSKVMHGFRHLQDDATDRINVAS